MHNKHLYPANWEELARACKERAGWQCERCGIASGKERISRRGLPYRVALMACHRDHSERQNPQAELLCLCAICHWWIDFEKWQIESWRKLESLKHQRLLSPKRIAALRVRAFRRVLQHL